MDTGSTLAERWPDRPGPNDEQVNGMHQPFLGSPKKFELLIENDCYLTQGYTRCCTSTYHPPHYRGKVYKSNLTPSRPARLGPPQITYAFHELKSFTAILLHR